MLHTIISNITCKKCHPNKIIFYKLVQHAKDKKRLEHLGFSRF